MQGPLKLAIPCLGALAGGVMLGSYWTSEPPSDITFLAVGQGDCTVVRGGGATFLVDAGPATDDFDAGSRIVAPKLREMGVDRISIVFLTHPDSDHIGGLAGLASRVRIDKVAAPAHFKGHPELTKSLTAARITERQVLWIDRPLAGETGSLRFQVQLPTFSKGDSENEGSLFLRFQMDGSSAVFTGDAGEETEAIEAAEVDWQADLLKAGHHGSATSTSSAWLQEVRPKTVVVSCGRQNRYGHPAQLLLERVQSAGAKVYRTDQDGDLTFVSTAKGFQKKLSDH